MKEKKLILLLHIISTKGSINRLVREGITYKHVTDLIERAVNSELLIYENEKISLTEKGIEYLKDGKEFLKKQNKEEWIDKESDSQLPKLDKNAVFLPKQNELTF